MSAKRMTFGELKTAVEAMTPEQLALPVVASAEEPGRGGFVEELFICQDDQVNPSGDGMEDISLYRPGGAGYEEGMEIDEEPIVARKGQGLLQLDDNAAGLGLGLLDALHDEIVEFCP